jgi:hypothetical protein
LHGRIRLIAYKCVSADTHFHSLDHRFLAISSSTDLISTILRSFSPLNEKAAEECAGNRRQTLTKDWKCRLIIIMISQDVVRIIGV